MRVKSKNRISHIVIMRRFHLVEKHNIFQFHRVSHDCALSDDGTAAYKRAVPHLCAMIDNAWRSQVRGRKHLRILSYPDFRLRMDEFIGGKPWPQAPDKRLNFFQDLPGILFFLKQGAASVCSKSSRSEI